ncbi:hypothetical protein [Pseudomonas cyclaminis]|uniref:hypothetical protein n=1 Tax=Pseudomonas cyclaminis TaxID=2781239 RepID=UPI002095E15F|nr:hypothetical protein [Pseudomonas cyclaminis]
MNPYLITGPAQIGVSGGRTSGQMLRKILDAHGGKLPADVHAFFQNTGKESEKTLVFIDRIDKRWNVGIVWMEWCRVYGQPDDAPWYKLVNFETASRNGEPFTMMLEYYAAYRKDVKNLPPVLPNFSNNMCTAYLKVKIGEKHMRALGYDEWDCVVGIRYDEPKRYHRMMAANARAAHDGTTFAPLTPQASRRRTSRSSGMPSRSIWAWIQTSETATCAGRKAKES